MWQLKPNGAFSKIAESSMKGSILIDPTLKDPFDGLDPLELASASTLKIGFANHADGRGFSLAKRLSEQFRHSSKRPKLVAVGKLIPDQARLAFQSGFDLIEIDDVEVSRHSEASWAEALRKTVAGIYFQTPVHQDTAASIWDARKAS